MLGYAIQSEGWGRGSRGGDIISGFPSGRLNPIHNVTAHPSEEGVKFVSNGGRIRYCYVVNLYLIDGRLNLFP